MIFCCNIISEVYYHHLRSEIPALLVTAGDMSIDLIGGDTMYNHTSEPFNSQNTHSNGIYIIRNVISGSFYIGSTTRSFRERKNEHWSKLKAGEHGNPILQASWRKHGEHSFVFEVIEVIEQPEDILPREQYWLDLYSQDDKCCNLGGACNRAGVPVSEETKRILSEKARQQMSDPAARKVVSESSKKQWSNQDYRERNIASRTGKRQSEESNRKRSETKKRLYAESEAYRSRMKRMHDIRWDNPGAKQRMADNLRKRWKDGDIRKKHEEKVAKVYDGFISPNGVIYRNVKNLMAFCREHNLNSSSMSDVFYGKRGRKSHKGWRRYYPEDN
jgi:group I intron endonuclease